MYRPKKVVPQFHNDPETWQFILSHIDRTPGPGACWPWTGQKAHKGYGRFRLFAAHRITYQAFNGPITPADIVRHTCDNPKCCNPAHLVLGTHADNVRDCVERRRIAAGSRNGKTTLTESDVKYILADPDGMGCCKLAEKFHITPGSISLIQSGQRWKYMHVPEDQRPPLSRPDKPFSRKPTPLSV